MNSKNKLTLYIRWVGMNGIGEMLGLGLTFVIGAIVISGLGDQQNIATILITFLVAVACGSIEATIVGLATMVGDESMVPHDSANCLVVCNPDWSAGCICTGYLPPL